MPAPRTLSSGTQSVASAFPDPPFEVSEQGADTGFDIELVQALCEAMGLRRTLVKFQGSDFNRIFDGLASSAYDVVISGTTITPSRQAVARFTDPYLESGQSLVVNTRRTPTIASVDDLAGQVVGIQVGNTSDMVAKELEAKGAIAGIKYYPYSGILDALDDLTAGTIGAVIKLLPVTTWLVKDRPDLAVVQEIPTHERLAIACALDNQELCDALNGALRVRQHDGTIDRLRKRWLE